MKIKLFLLMLLISQVALCQSKYANDRIQTTYFTLNVPTIDGYANDAVWNNAEWSENFIQYSPIENTSPTQSTRFKIIYDAGNLYILVRAYDSFPSGIDRKITARDAQEGDLISLQFDSYNDELTAFVFCTSASESKTDKIFTNNGLTEDLTWDPIWFVKTSIDTLGWIAEFRIPFSQLRFNKELEHEWGLQVVRVEYRNQETSVWKYIPRDAAGWVHHFGILTGLNNINPKRLIEIAPYTVTRLSTRKPEDKNPILNSREYNIYGGIDGKIGVTNDITLDFTINPDFGQVESDASEVNLSAWETYFEDKRPFFVEGKNLFEFNTQYNDHLFYSRRIGRKPQATVERFDFADLPENTSILGAFKLTGKTRNGFSMGIIESITNEEIARTQSGNIRENVIVEPYTNYFISRFQKDLAGGNTRVGAMFTSTNREKTNSDLLLLHRAAYTGGLDLNHNWKNKTYFVNLRLIGSRVEGDPKTITRTQLSPLRYYQRPDAPYVHLDTTMTSLTGHGGMLEFGKAGEGHWNFETVLNWHSPGLETNDAGYLQTTDGIGHSAKIQYNYYKPTCLFRNFNLALSHLLVYNYGLIFCYETTILNTSFLLRNFWNLSTSTEINGDFYSNSTTRGGPIIKLPGNIVQSMLVKSDPKKIVSANFGIISITGFNKAEFAFKTQSIITLRLKQGLNLGIAHEYTKLRNELQYVTTKEFNDKRYIFATVHQLINRFSARVNYNISPELSLQYYVQPFISSVDYSEYKLVTNPRADKFDDRFRVYNPEEIAYHIANSRISIDENRDGSIDYAFDKPDFKSLDFISNLVIRWEYRPGSTIYLVWSQNRIKNAEPDHNTLGQNFHELSNLFPNNIFLVKFSYRIH